MSLAVYLFAVGWPLVMAFALLFPAARGILWRMLPLAALPALMLGLLQTTPELVQGDWFVLGLSMGLDPISRLFVIFTATLWIAASASARHWMREDAHATGFGVLFLMAMSGNLGLILSKDAMAFYGAFALMSFASYGLVLHNRDRAAQSAAKLYIAFVVIGELILFSGLVLAATQSGSILLEDMRAADLSGLAVALLLVGFGIKLGVMPLHFWLPPAHGSAPVPASAVLSGAMIKAGLFGIISVVPVGLKDYADHATLVMAAGMVTTFAAVLLGVHNRNAKTVLGYSSVSQMGIIVLGLGAALLSPAIWSALLPVLVFLAAHHALAKGALFLGVGAWAAQTGTLARLLIGAVLLVPALVLAGLPFSSGALGKEALKDVLALGSEVWSPWLTLTLTLSGLATTLLMARVLANLWLNPPKAPQSKPDALALPAIALAGAAFALPALWPILDAERAASVLTAKPAAIWPVALGIAISMTVAISAYAQTIGIEAFLSRITAPFRASTKQLGRLWSAKRRAARRMATAIPRYLAEHALRWRLGQTAVAGTIAALMIIEAIGVLAPARDKTPVVLQSTQMRDIQLDMLDMPDLQTGTRVEDALEPPNGIADLPEVLDNTSDEEASTDQPSRQ